VKFTRRHARALAAGAATTAAYLAAGRAAGSTPVRATGLLLLATTAIAGVQASAVAKTTKKRLDQHVADTAAAVHFVAHGGTVGGAVTVSGSLTATGGLLTSGAAITTSGGNLSMGSGDITCQDITATGGTGSTFGHIVMSGGNINMGGNNCNTGSAYVVSGAPHRANLGSVAFTSAGLQSVADRDDFILNTAGTGAGWAS
jgi:hypothetical protein